MAIATRRTERKIPVERLQEQHLSGPATEESIDEIRDELGVDHVVPVKEMPRMEKIIFRNQRDPGHPLEFHAHTKEHPYKNYKLIDGHEYLLPYDVVKNLESCRENIEKFRRNSEGLPEIYVAGYKTHFVCERA